MSDDLPVPSPVEPEPPDKSEDDVQSSASQRRMNNLDNNQDNNQSPSSVENSPSPDAQEVVNQRSFPQPNLPTQEHFRIISEKRSQDGLQGLNFRAATAGVEVGANTKWIFFHMEKSIKSVTWTLTDKELSDFLYGTLKLKKGQVISYDESYNTDHAFAIEIPKDLDESKLPIGQGLELKKGLRTKPVRTGLNSNPAGVWVRIYKT